MSMTIELRPRDEDALKDLRRHLQTRPGDPLPEDVRRDLLMFLLDLAPANVPHMEPW